MIYRFIGTECNIGAIKLNLFGQRLEVTPEIARQCQLGGAAILSDVEFKKLGFSSEELKIWASPFMDYSQTPTDSRERKAMAAFLDKRRKARQLFQSNAAKLKSNRKQPAVAPIISSKEDK